MPLLILLYPFAEFYLFYRAMEAYSFLDVLMFVISSSLIGMLIMKIQGRKVFLELQTALVQGKVPTNQDLHRGMIMLGGLMLFLPGIISDIFGTLLILPGTRHLLMGYVKWMMTKGLMRGNIKVFSSGFGFSAQTSRRDVRDIRDAQIVDVTPIEISSQKIDS